MPRIVVRLANGYRRSVVCSRATTVDEAVDLLAKALDLKQPQLFGLKLARQTENGHQVAWLLAGQEPIAEINGTLNSGDYLSLNVKEYFVDLESLFCPVAIELFYEEIRFLFVNGSLPASSVDDAARLAALQLQTRYGDMDQHKPINKLREVLPGAMRQVKSQKRWRNSIETVQALCVGQDQMTSRKLFLDAVSRMPLFGVQFFNASSMDRTMLFSLGVCPRGIGIYDRATKELGQLIDYGSLSWWQFTDWEDRQPSDTPSAALRSKGSTQYQKVVLEFSRRRGDAVMKTHEFLIERAPDDYNGCDSLVRQYFCAASGRLQTHVDVENVERPVPLTVHLLDDTVISMRVCQETLVSTVIDEIARQKELETTLIFGLCEEQPGKTDRWLSDATPVLEQRVHENSHLVLKVRFWFPRARDDLEPIDRRIGELQFLQLWQSFMHHGVPTVTNYVDGVDLAASYVVRTAAVSATNVPSQDEIKENLEKYLPPSALPLRKRKQWARAIFERATALFNGVLDTKRVPRDSETLRAAAVARFLQVAAQLRFYGVSFFRVRVNKITFGQTKGINSIVGRELLMGVSPRGVGFYEIPALNTTPAPVGNYVFEYAVEVQDFEQTACGVTLQIRPPAERVGPLQIIELQTIASSSLFDLARVYLKSYVRGHSEADMWRYSMQNLSDCLYMDQFKDSREISRGALWVGLPPSVESPPRFASGRAFRSPALPEPKATVSNMPFYSRTRRDVMTVRVYLTDGTYKCLNASFGTTAQNIVEMAVEKFGFEEKQDLVLYKRKNGLVGHVIPAGSEIDEGGYVLARPPRTQPSTGQAGTSVPIATASTLNPTAPVFRLPPSALAAAVEPRILFQEPSRPAMCDASTDPMPPIEPPLPPFIPGPPPMPGDAGFAETDATAAATASADPLESAVVESDKVVTTIVKRTKKFVKKKAPAPASKVDAEVQTDHQEPWMGEQDTLPPPPLDDHTSTRTPLNLSALNLSAIPTEHAPVALPLPLPALLPLAAGGGHLFNSTVIQVIAPEENVLVDPSQLPLPDRALTDTLKRKRGKRKVAKKAAAAAPSAGISDENAPPVDLPADQPYHATAIVLEPSIPFSTGTTPMKKFSKGTDGLLHCVDIASVAATIEKENTPPPPSPRVMVLSAQDTSFKRSPMGSTSNQQPRKLSGTPTKFNTSAQAPVLVMLGEGAPQLVKKKKVWKKKAAAKKAAAEAAVDALVTTDTLGLETNPVLASEGLPSFEPVP